MSHFPQKIVGLFISLILVHLVEIIMLSIVCDYIGFLKSKNVPLQNETNVHITRLVCDTIHAEEIEIFPLMDLDGNVVCE